MLELDRQHKRLHNAVEDALKPEPQAWRSVRSAKTDYDAAYAELTSLSKRLNQLIQTENLELARPADPQSPGSFGFVESRKRRAP